MNKPTIIAILLAIVLMLTSCNHSAQKTETENQVDNIETSSIVFPHPTYR